MTHFEDHFSRQARQYAHYRPQYPGELFDYLASLAPARRLAWDCGTGNGQAACQLARHFERVLATDASADQVSHAVPHERVEYRVQRAEDVDLADSSVDLITVAQAVHWFDLDSFYRIVRRVLRPDGVIAVWMYHLPVIDPSTDPVLSRYYLDILGGYWPDRFHFLANQYRDLPFPFAQIQPPAFEMQARWTLDQLVGFLESWSAAQRYLQARGHNPVSLIWPDLAAAWGKPDQPRHIRWPIKLLAGRVNAAG